ncbi:MAG TPA: rRNA maturation RNase YbeY [Saprospiraceae bacterium]|nr:rRNA maturation RNase YbeY [Saprospiraceae bacterium]HMQ82232.1 rRNA maturation RNase YbeY [Saprospiraceae bacterium]
MSEAFFEEEDDQPIAFFVEDIDFDWGDTEKTTRWIEDIIAREKRQLQQLTYIFCSDEYLHQINLEYLQHDDLTDIITFPYSQPPYIEGDIFISIERVKENAATYQTSFEQELRRVMIHGVLHLCGYPDKTEAEAATMRKKEEEALQIWAEM